MWNANYTTTGVSFLNTPLLPYRQNGRVHWVQDGVRHFSQVPRAPDNLYNCSVPRLHIFKPLLGYNMVRECQGNEDEKGCSYASTDCGDGALDAGTKCYRFVRREGFTTWNEASSNCTEGNERLVTLASRDDFARFRQIMATVKDPRTVVIGTAVERNTIRDSGCTVQTRMAMAGWQKNDFLPKFFFILPRAVFTIPSQIQHLQMIAI